MFKKYGLRIWGERGEKVFLLVFREVKNLGWGGFVYRLGYCLVMWVLLLLGFGVRISFIFFV